MTLLLFDSRQYSRQFGLHLIPREVDACIVLQIPVNTRSDVHPRVASHHDLRALLVEFKEVLVALYQLCLELRGSTLVDTLQKLVHRIRKSE